MEQKINIAELLKNAPKGTKLYSPICGEVVFEKIKYTNTNAESHHFQDANVDCSIRCYTFIDDMCTVLCFDPYGRKYRKEGAECTLFPSKDNRDWSTFNVPWKHKHFEPFQKVLIKCNGKWVPRFYGYYTTFDNRFINHITCNGISVSDDAIIPYEGNEDKVGKEVK